MSARAPWAGGSRVEARSGGCARARSDAVKSMRQIVIIFPPRVQALHSGRDRSPGHSPPGSLRLPPVPNESEMKTSSPSIRKVQFAFGAAILVLIAAGAISYRSLVESRDANLWVQHTHRVLERLQDLRWAIESMESSYRGFVVTGKDPYFESYRGSISSVEQDETALGNLTVDNPEQQRQLPILERLVAQKIEFAEMLCSLRRTQGFEASSQVVGQGEGLRLTKEITVLTQRMEAMESRLLQVRTEASQARTRQARWVMVLGTLLALGLVVMANGIVRRDVAERRRAEEALEKQAALLEEQARIVDLAPAAIIVRDLESRITLWNPEAEKIYGWTREEAMGKITHELFQTQFPEPLAQIESQALGGESWQGELLHTKRNGERIVVASRWAARRDSQGNPAGFLEVNADITVRKRAEEALIEERYLLNTLLHDLPNVIFFKDRKSRFTRISSAGARLAGLSDPAQVVGKTDFDLFTPEHAQEAFRDEQAIMETGQRVVGKEEKETWQDGRVTWASSTKVPMHDTQGNIIGVFGARFDITERKHAEEEISKLNAELEQRVRERTAELEAANKELEAFTYSVSHDLRAPLRHVDGFSKLLVEKYARELSPDAREYVATIRESAVQMGMLIDDLLNLARVGRRPLSMQVTGLNSLVEEVRGDLLRAHPDRVIEWKIATLPFVECDPALMKQVFANLLSNAVKYTRPRNPAVIEVGAAQQNGASAVFVRDNGVGFSMKYANKLFGVFQRLHRSEDFEGTGVGLATVQRILHKHGGRAWAEAELDKGATFYFTLGSA